MIDLLKLVEKRKARSMHVLMLSDETDK